MTSAHSAVTSLTSSACSYHFVERLGPETVQNRGFPDPYSSSGFTWVTLARNALLKKRTKLSSMLSVEATGLRRTLIQSAEAARCHHDQGNYYGDNPSEESTFNGDQWFLYQRCCDGWSMTTPIREPAWWDRIFVDSPSYVNGLVPMFKGKWLRGQMADRSAVRTTICSRIRPLWPGNSATTT